jgi:hypothetical protein
MQGLLAAVAALAVLALLESWNPDPPLNQQNASAVAVNFMVYRSAVQTYYSASPSAGPVVATAALVTPTGYRSVVAWQNLRPSGGPVFVYGAGGGAALGALVDEYGSQLGAVGLIENGRLISPLWGDLGVSVPEVIPNGSLAAVVQPD